MKFNKNILALCISSAIFAHCSVAETTTDKISAYANTTKSSGSYTVYLSSKSALTKHVVGKHNYKNEANAIKAEQQALFASIQAISPTAKLLRDSQLLSNFITVSLTDTDLDEIKALDNVQTILENNDTKRVTVSTSNSASIKTTTEEETLAEPELMTPYTGEADAGEGVSVAIISTGIDYTSKFFGGSGVYGEDDDPETPPAKGSYLEALENGAVGPSTPAVVDDPETEEDETADAVLGFDGFPTEIVAGGWDFSSENWGNDANPIDQNLEYIDEWSGWTYPTGEGTEIASIVHQLAPGAKLYAYKVSNLSTSTYDDNELQYSLASSDTVTQALEHALDPNQDGDTSDHLDIAVIDASGSAAFFDNYARGGAAGVTDMQLIVETASALGLTIVTHAGIGANYSTLGNETEIAHRGWTSFQGAVTSAITVGSVISGDDGKIMAADWSPMGPVRGSQALKPELVTYADNIAVSKISTLETDGEDLVLGTRTDALSAAAKIAAAAAVVKSAHPELGPVEIKALLANTASEKNISESNSDVPAELILIGHGIENVDAAVSTPVAAWEKSTYQPYVQFGVHEVGESKRVVKSITLRNLSDSAQTYEMSFVANGDKTAQSAIEFNFPSSVSVPANQSVDITVEVNIDGTALPEWPLQTGEDFTDANLKSTELNGYFQFTSTGNPELNVGWMIKARNETTLEKLVKTEEYPSYLGWDSETGETLWQHLSWAEQFYPSDEDGSPTYSARVSSFINESQTPTTLEAYPLIIDKPTEPVGKEDVSGHKIRAVGGGIYDDARCEITGKKLSIAVSLFQPADLAMANYTDKMGTPIFFYDLYHQYIVEENNWNESFDGSSVWDEAETFNQPFVQLNDKGQPTTYYIDYNQEYNWEEPNARKKESILPVHFSNNSKNIVSELCLEELYHHEIDSVEDFDQNLGFHIETDRDSGTDIYEPMAQFNPIKSGYYNTEEYCGINWFGEEYCEVAVLDESVRVGFANITDENPIDTADFTNVYTAQPGEEVTIAAATYNSDNERKFMVLSTSDNFFQVATSSYSDDDGGIIADVRAGQEFNLDENPEMDQVIGVIQLDTQGFFADANDSKYSEHKLFISNTIPGTPFAINQDTHELYVVNPDALDYEQMTSIEVLINTIVNGTGLPQTVTVMLNNVNDMAPEVMADVAAAVPAVNILIDGDEASAFEIDFTGVFVEAEGQGLTYTVSASGLNGVTVEGTKVVGNATEEGSYTVTVTASDGVLEASANFAVNVEQEESKSSGGSFGGFILALAGLSLFRRRK